MNCELGKAFESGELVCLKLAEAVDDFLIGISEAYDEGGVLLLNIDYKGDVTGHVYLAASKIVGFIKEPYYIRRVKALLGGEADNQEIVRAPEKSNIKEYFLEWIFEQHKLMKITFADEQLQGYICEIRADAVVLDIIDNVSYRRNGFAAIRKTNLSYFDAEK